MLKCKIIYVLSKDQQWPPGGGWTRYPGDAAPCGMATHGRLCGTEVPSTDRCYCTAFRMFDVGRAGQSVQEAARLRGQGVKLR